MSYRIDAKQYGLMYGPTVGDSVRLADTNLFAKVERDYTIYGEEVKFGGGKTIRDGMGQSVRTTHEDGDLDLVITNALVIDYTGIFKADIGIRDGKIAGIGKAGHHGWRDEGHDHWRLHGSFGRGRDDPDGRRDRYPYPFYLPTADRLRIVFRSYYHDRRGNRTG